MERSTAARMRGRRRGSLAGESLLRRGRLRALVETEVEAPRELAIDVDDRSTIFFGQGAAVEEVVEMIAVGIGEPGPFPPNLSSLRLGVEEDDVMFAPSIVEAECTGVPLELEREHALDDPWRSVVEQAEGEAARQSSRALCEDVRYFGGAALDHERRLSALHRHDAAFGHFEQAGATLVVRAVFGESTPQIVHPVGDDGQLRVRGRFAVHVHDGDSVQHPVMDDVHVLCLLPDGCFMTAQR